MIAKHGTAYHVEKLVSKYRRVVRLNDAEAVRTVYDNRQLSCYYDHDGSLVIKGRFPAEQGALIVKALEMAMEKQFAEKADVGASHEHRVEELVGAASAATDRDHGAPLHDDPHIEDGPHVPADQVPLG